MRRKWRRLMRRLAVVASAVAQQSKATLLPRCCAAIRPISFEVFCADSQLQHATRATLGLRSCGGSHPTPCSQPAAMLASSIGDRFGLLLRCCCIARCLLAAPSE
jgi:hypothetical protein